MDEIILLFNTRGNYLKKYQRSCIGEYGEYF